MKRKKIVPLLRQNRSARQKKSQGHGQQYMEIKGLYYTIKGNARLRTLTIRAFDGGKLYAKYRTIPQTPADYNYYTEHATQGDIKQLLKTNDYYVIR